ncbi:hypothetical protein [Aliarcobacter butzleri]|uniref:hypothetical protein n=1 Tax=Aliarcobacter butzleri TaxID=28197 RepID=UPI002B24E55A|nr:hypothetical protein [Aliarcobacter butzleri]
MDFAKCELDSQVYGAYKFSQLSNSDISQKRRHLVCNSCGAKAYFKKKSKSGQAACFGARPHYKECDLVTEESQTCTCTLENDERELINSGNFIDVDFDFITKATTHITPENDDEDSKGLKGSRHSSVNGIGTAKSKRKLKSLLNMLLNDLNFSKSNQKIDIGHSHPYNASTIFKKFSQLSCSDINKTRGIYGQIFDVNEFKTDIWINSGGFDDCSIVIEYNLHYEFYKRFPEYTDLEDLNGKYVLCFGEVLKSTSDKYFIKLDDISKIVFK